MGQRGQPALHDYTGYLLRRAFVKASGIAQECMPDDAHVREAAVLAIIEEHGALSQRELSDLTHVNQTLIVKLVDVLEHKGWVRRDRSPADRRSYALAISAAGKHARTALDADLDRGEADLTQNLTRDEVDELRTLLTRLLDGDQALLVASLANRTGYLIAHAHRRLRARAEGMLEPLGLHPRDFGALSALAESQPCSQNALALRMGITPPAALGLVDELEARGLVARARKAGDRRFYDLTLSERGGEVLAQARKLAARAQADIVEHLGHDGDERLRVLLKKLID
ncbi:MAG TPA: MarR family transcriptional regulator [Nocardioidaceae bacterium]|nr:MarR family transcriptional regulator [Nocardioidaceae bacterium]